MTQYLMAVWHDDDYDPDFSSEEVQRAMAKTGAYNDELVAAGAWVFAGGLQSATSSATVLRATETGVSMTDGPYAETKEQMGGFWVIDVGDFDTAPRLGAPGHDRLRRAGRTTPIPRCVTTPSTPSSGQRQVAALRA